MPERDLSFSPRPLQVIGVAQGVVIGDHNDVTINAVHREPFIAREAPALPAHWVERSDLLDRAVTALVPGAAVALVGMGGAGKSSLASCIAQAAAARFPAGCFWIDLAATDADESLLHIALAFGHDLSPLTSRAARAATVRSLLTGKPVLLVLDDAWDTAALAPFLPPPAGCAAIITTRNDAVASHAATDVLEVRELGNADASALLAAAAQQPVALPLIEMASALGGLPLALELAGRLLRQQARRPGFQPEKFARELVDGASRLSIGLAGSTVRAVFDESWNRALDAETRRGFALLGVFQPGPIATAEAAAAWDLPEADALRVVNELIDLSLVRCLDAVTIQLHPLLLDYAAEKQAALDAEEAKAAHRRLADYLFRIAARPPRTLTEMAVVLRSHHHAATAGDGDRAKRVYPWFGEGSAQVAVPGFLIDHGQHRTHALHERLQHALAAGLGAWGRMWAEYRLASALIPLGELPEARERLHTAIALIEQEDEDARAVGHAKFLMTLGQVELLAGDPAAAEAALQRAIALDRATAERGGVSGALSNALTSMLQLADVHREAGTQEGAAAADRICREVVEQAADTGEAQVAVMALARLARLHEHSDTQHALSMVLAALGVHEQRADAFAGRQGSRYARMLADAAVAIAYQGEAALDAALALYAIAIDSAGLAGATQELASALYQLGNLLEHYHLLEREPALAAAWACYEQSDRLTEGMEGERSNARERIEHRIRPRLSAAEQVSAAARVSAQPWPLIEEALRPHTLSWRPADQGR